MKKIIFFIVLCTSSMGVSAQSLVFWQKVDWGLRHLSGARSIEQLNKATSIFKGLSANNNGSYLPDYYVALSLAFEVEYHEQTSTRDSLADSAIRYIAKAEALSPNNAEIEFLRGFTLTKILKNDPIARGELYAQQVILHYEKVMALEPNNPRAPTFLALSMLEMPQYFSSETYNPCELASKGKELFPGYHKDRLLIWGSEIPDRILKFCN